VTGEMRRSWRWVVLGRRGYCDKEKDVFEEEKIVTKGEIFLSCESDS
jgi:hypothetical protein